MTNKYYIMIWSYLPSEHCKLVFVTKGKTVFPSPVTASGNWAVRAASAL